MAKRKGKSVRKNKHVNNAEPEEITKAPHSFVVHRGKTGKFVENLTKDFRKVMEPYTATSIKARPKNTIKDYVHVAGLLKVSHFCMFSKTNIGPYLKLARFPRGPTMTFRINDYTLARDVRSSLKRQVTYEKQYQNHPLLIMNSFTGEDKGVQLMESMFRNMFPSINVNKIKLNTIRRAVLLNYNQDTKTIDFRHYTIKVVPVGMSRGVKKIVSSKIPNLGKFDSMADFLMKGGAASESEGEDDEASHVTLPQALSSRGSGTAGNESSVRLVELGPRMTLQLLKIEDGLLDGEVLYHDFIEKTDEEVKEIRIKREKKRKEKEKRKRVQDENVKKKEKEKEEHKQKSLDGMKKPDIDKATLPEGEDWMGEQADDNNQPSDDDDEEWYRKEVGEKPDKELFAGKSKGSHFDGGARFKKKGARGGGSKGRGRGGSSGLNRSDSKPDYKGRKGKKAEKGDDRKSNKGRLRVFNSDGVGPNFKQGGPKKNKLKGVRGGKVSKRGRK